MRMKALLGIAALAFAGVSFAGTRFCEILLPQQTHAGATVLAPGQYRVEWDGPTAIFTNVMTRRTFAAPVKVATTKTHETTAIEVDKRGGGRFLKSIDLANSNQTLQFE
jgi:hypothetical protein